MANLLRLISGLLLLCLASASFALSPMIQFRGQSATTGGWLGWRYSPAEACADILASVVSDSANTDGGYSYSVASSTETGCFIRRSDGGKLNFPIDKSSQAMCIANSTRVGDACICNEGFTEKSGQCVSKQSPDMRCAGDFTMAGFGIGAGMGAIRDTKTVSGVVPSGEMCWPYDSASSGCLVNFDRTGLTTMPDGSIQSTGSFTMYKGGVGGKACTVAAPTEGDTEVSEKCDQKGSYTDSKGTHNLCLDAPKCEGGFGGEVGGVEVCVKDKGGNVIETSKDTIKKNEDGSTDKVTEKTTCKGNVCTTEKTTTTTTNNNASSSSTTTKTESKEDYCKANANSAQCKGEDDDKEKGKFGGSCSAGFTCEGDPLQCAIAKDQHKRNCQMFDDKTTESQLYDSEVAKGTDRDVTKDLPGNTEVDVSGKLSSEDLLGGGRCISDLSVEVWFTSVTLPFSRICPSLDYLGWVLVSVCSLAAFRIVSVSSKED